MTTSAAVLDLPLKLNELPGELILEILQHLAVIRGYRSGPTEEDARRQENVRRVAALHGLTLTCRRLNDIATPFLYESIGKLGQRSDWSNVQSLLRTITKRPKLMDYVRYIETDGEKFDENLSNTLETMLEHIAPIDYSAYTVESKGDRYFSCVLVIFTLISLARNLQSLAIDGFWHEEGVYQMESNLALCDVSLRNFHSEGGNICISAAYETRFKYSPALMILSQIGAIRVGKTWLGAICMHRPGYNRGQRRGRLPRIDDFGLAPLEELFLEGNINIKLCRKLLARCDSLRRLRCRWTAGNGGLGARINLEDYRKILQPFENTLESLVVDTLESTWLVGLEEHIPTIGSLREFKNLKHIEVSGMVLWSDDDDQETDGTFEHPRLSSVLPAALETFVVNVEWDDYVEDALVGLAEDRAAYFPNLKTVVCTWRPAPMFVGRHLITEFERAGVKIELDVACCTEEEEKRFEAEMIRMEKETSFMDERAEAVQEDLRRFDEEWAQIHEAMPAS